MVLVVGVGGWCRWLCWCMCWWWIWQPSWISPGLMLRAEKCLVLASTLLLALLATDNILRLAELSLKEGVFSLNHGDGKFSE